MPSFEMGFMYNPFDPSSQYTIMNTIDNIEFENLIYDHYDPQVEAAKRLTWEEECEDIEEDTFAVMGGLQNVGPGFHEVQGVMKKEKQLRPPKLMFMPCREMIRIMIKANLKWSSTDTM
jgi:hypothetical protein